MRAGSKAAVLFASSFLVLNSLGLVSAQESTLSAQQDLAPGEQRLTDDRVTAFVDLALKGIEQQYPNKPGNVLASAKDIQSPQEMHPVFYGCFDWHSSVHGHWLLVRLLKLYPENSRAQTIRDLLNKQLDLKKLQQEAEYFEAKENRSFERMYGWAWALRLASELHTWQDEDAQRWSENLRPLEDKIVELTLGYLPRLSYPIRIGEHTDTGFALAQILDYAQAVGNDDLSAAIREFALEKYLADTDYPARYEPSGHDFFSTCLNEADLMRRVLSKEEFSDWLERFLPELVNPKGSAKSILTPEKVSDTTDGKLVHLAGLNFNRAWTQAGVASALAISDPRRKTLEASIIAHREAGLQYVFSGHYEGEHWLATFAVYVLTGSGI